MHLIDSSEIDTRMQDGCYASGLYLEGAGWDIQKAVLKRQEPKNLICELPVMKVINPMPQLEPLFFLPYKHTHNSYTNR